MQLDSTCDLLEVLIHVKQSCWHQHILTINHCWVYQISLVSCSNPSDLQAHTAVQTLSNLKCYPSHLRQNPTAWLEAFPIGHPTRIHGLLCRENTSYHFSACRFSRDSLHLRATAGAHTTPSQTWILLNQKELHGSL